MHVCVHLHVCEYKNLNQSTHCANCAMTVQCSKYLLQFNICNICMACLYINQLKSLYLYGIWCIFWNFWLFSLTIVQHGCQISCWLKDNVRHIYFVLNVAVIVVKHGHSKSINSKNRLSICLQCATENIFTDLTHDTCCIWSICGKMLWF